MSRSKQTEGSTGPADSPMAQATQWFLRVRSESAQAEDLTDLRNWLELDPRNKLAYQQVTAAWGAVGQLSSAPEVMIGRRDALDDARRAARGRWSSRRGVSRYAAVAASVFVAVASVSAWFYSQRGVYATNLGERRVLTLEDGSVVTLDAKSRVRLKYGENERLIALERGQARFDVAKDASRPFRVRARDQTVIALGTQFNVEIVANDVVVSLIEGLVAVTGLKSSARDLAPEAQGTAPAEQLFAKSQDRTVELKAGESLRVRGSDRTSVLSQVDLSRATAWQAGKMFFDNEPLASAAERINRYSKLQIEVDPSVASVGVSGVFNAADANAFIEAISTYFSVQVERKSPSEIHLTSRN